MPLVKKLKVVVYVLNFVCYKQYDLSGWAIIPKVELVLVQSILIFKECYTNLLVLVRDGESGDRSIFGSGGMITSFMDCDNTGNLNQIRN